MTSNEKKAPVALVTGGTAGIGKSIALSMAEEGYSIILNSRRPEKEVEELMARIEDISGKRQSCVYIRGDIADSATRKEILSLIENQFSSLQVLVNNAGISTANRKDMLELTEEDMIHLLKTNLIAPFLLAASLAPYMKSDTSVNYMVNISSISAYTVSTNRADYCISKAGLSMMTKLFAERLAGDNIRVFEIRPGIIHTDMTAPVKEKYDHLIENNLLPIGRWGVPEDVAKTVVGIVKGYHPYATGDVINVDGGFHIRRL
ncbi:MAG: 3-ketoacyl-ACP reductase [Desulfobacterales bacterium]|nr:3-ketoacyl-ACP reductase [Desulfobacterales bacterium]